MPLRYEGAAGLSRLLSRARRTRRVRVTFVVVAIVAAILGAGGAAIAHEMVRSDADQAFRHLHPDKNEVTDTGVEPNVLAGTVSLPHGVRAQLYVTTTEDSRGSCAYVRQVAADGHRLGGVGFCRGTTDADVQRLNGALVGYVPGVNVAAVEVSGPAGVTQASVSHHFFLLAPTVGNPGANLTITQYDGTGHKVETFVVVVE